MDISYGDYWKEIGSIGKECRGLAAENDTDISDEILTYIDGHRWIIYNAYHFDILRHSDNEESLLDNSELCIDSSTSLFQITAQFAFWAMYTDVMENLEEEEN